MCVEKTSEQTSISTMTMELDVGSVGLAAWAAWVVGVAAPVGRAAVAVQAVASTGLGAAVV
jgi:hypothetical protein